VHTIESERERRIFTTESTEGTEGGTGKFYHEEHEGHEGRWGKKQHLNIFFDRLKTRLGEIDRINRFTTRLGEMKALWPPCPQWRKNIFYRRDRKETQRKSADTHQQIQECIYPQIKHPGYRMPCGL